MYKRGFLYFPVYGDGPEIGVDVNYVSLRDIEARNVIEASRPLDTKRRWMLAEAASKVRILWLHYQLGSIVV